METRALMTLISAAIIGDLLGAVLLDAYRHALPPELPNVRVRYAQ